MKWEVRVITYQRPDWLHRSLSTLLAQTYTDWVAFILDDSPAREGEAVVKNLGDSRLRYTPNLNRLGQAGNIDQGFHPRPRIEGADAMFVLEADNYLHPDFLKDSTALLKSSEVDGLQWNQLMFSEEDSAMLGRRETTRDGFFADGILRREDILPHLPFHTGLSNGGLAWKAGCKSNWFVGPVVTNASLQEAIRSLRLVDRLLYISEPRAYFRHENKSFGNTSRWSRLRELRARLELCQVIQRRADRQFWNTAGALAARHTADHEKGLETYATLSLHSSHDFKHIPRKSALRKIAKYRAIRAVISDPYKPIWETIP